MSLFGRNHTGVRRVRGSMLPLLVVAVMLGLALAPLIQPGSADARADRPRIDFGIDSGADDPTVTIDPDKIQVQPTPAPTRRTVEIVDPEVDVDQDDLGLGDGDDAADSSGSDIDVMSTETPAIDPNYDPDLDVFPTATAESGDDVTIKLPPGTVLIETGDEPTIELPPCSELEETILRLPPGTVIDKKDGTIKLPDNVDFELRETRYELAGRDEQLYIRLPEGVDLIEEDGGITIFIPICDDSVEQADGDGVISISKVACPVGFDAYGADVYGLSLECQAPLADVTFLLSDGNQAIGQSVTDGSGGAGFDSVPAIPVSIVEQVPAGYGEPIVYCQINVPSSPQPGDTVQQPVLDGNQIFLIMPEAAEVNCLWYNVPAETTDAGDGEGEIAIAKLECPVGFDAQAATIYDLAFTCQQPMSDVTFILSDGGSALAQGTTDANGQTGFTGVPAIPVSIVEQVPPGYGAPRVFCLSGLPGDNAPGETIEQTVLDGNQIFYLMGEGEFLGCSWYNIPLEDDGSITIIKYTCPDGYDFLAYGADPREECKSRTNDVDFTVAGDGYLQTLPTGSAGDKGKVVFDGLPQGDYYVTEAVPAGIEAVFVLECDGLIIDLIQAYPLSVGPELLVPVGPGTDVVCRWYNVPAHDQGAILITKYACPTEYFVSVDDCVIYEHGVGFELSAAYSGNWIGWGSGTTNGGGELLFGNLDPGVYQIDEIGNEWCRAASDSITDDGYLVVTAGETTYVNVWNCGVTYEKEPPIKYPNTGVAPGNATSDQANAPVGSSTQPVLRPEQWQGAMDGRLFAFVGSGERPVAIRVESVGIDASAETLEIIDGEMQAPTTGDQVGWYKETAKLATDGGNVVIAGHLNYWGMPEGVFFRLTAIEAGDEIVVTGERGGTYVYRVTSVTNEDAFSDDLDHIAGQTGDPVLTLITCGGEWDASAQLYDKRTVVRAELISAS